MSGAPFSSPLAPSTNHLSLRPVLVVLGAATVAALLLFSALFGTAGPLAGHGSVAVPGLRAASDPPTPANFSVTAPVANNSPVDVMMAFNVSVQILNLSGGLENNTTNYTFAWSGLPAFVPGIPGSGCYGAVPGSTDNNSSVENCQAASKGSLSISATATYWNTTTPESNTSVAALAITVNVDPTMTAFTVNGGASVKVPVGTSITFSVTASGGTGTLNYTYTGLPLGCVGNTSSLTCTPTRAGSYNVSVVVTDSYDIPTLRMNVTVTITTPTTTSSGIGTTGWGIVIGILVVGALITVALLLQARREERAGRMGMEETPQEPPSEYGGTPPMGGTPPPGPPG